MDTKKDKGKRRQKLPRVSTELPKDVADQYYKKCEMVFGLERQGHVPLRKFVHDFINGRIYIVDGVLHIREKK